MVKQQANGKIKVIVTGATGMVGEGVLHECLQHPQVEQILVVSRKSTGILHPKLEEVVLPDLAELEPIKERIDGYDACFYCLGISSAGMTEEKYSQITYDLTLHMAELLASRNREMVFFYVTAGGTDNTEQGRSMWARVKGRTENALLQLPFKAAYMFRPGYIHPTKGLRNTHGYYGAISWMYPALRRLFPKYVITLSELGRAMIHAALSGYDKSIVESKDMAELAARRLPAE